MFKWLGWNALNSKGTSRVLQRGLDKTIVLNKFTEAAAFQTYSSHCHAVWTKHVSASRPEPLQELERVQWCQWYIVISCDISVLWCIISRPPMSIFMWMFFAYRIAHLWSLVCRAAIQTKCMQMHLFNSFGPTTSRLTTLTTLSLWVDLSSQEAKASLKHLIVPFTKCSSP